MKKLLKKISRLCFAMALMLFMFNFLDIPYVTCTASSIPAVPTSVKAASSSYNSINVSWNGVAGASGYAVYRAVSSKGTYSLVSTTSAKNFNNTGLSTGKTYYYKIRAYRTAGKTKVYGNYSSASSSTPVMAVPASVKAASSSYNSINISWNGITGASGYAVYRAVSSKGTYTLISTTNANNINNTGLSTGTTYYYKVRAYRTVGTTRVYGSYSSVTSSNPVPSVPASIKAEASSYNGVNVSWDGVAGASGYTVYRSASESGTYLYITTINANNFNDTGLSPGTTYYYKIRVYRTVGKTKIYGNYSSAASAEPILSVPASVNAVLSPDNSINISWGDVTGASGYEVYRTASSEGDYTLLLTTGEKNYNDTGLANGTTYYYKVRAYRTVGSTNVYSDFSSAVNVTTAGIVKVTSINLSKTTDSIVVQNTDTLTATLEPQNATDKTIIWTSSDNSIATVDNTGKVTAINAGTATISATSEDGSVSANCIVSVNDGSFNGIDVSSWQGTIDWASVKNAGVQFAMIRSSYGDGTSSFTNNGVDPMFQTNYAEAKANGIAVGVYHYSYAKTVAEAAQEVNFFISQIKGKQFDYPVCVDLEDPSQSNIDMETLTNIALTYLNALQQAGYYPMIYSNKKWFTSVLDDTKLTSYDHWLAQYNTSITYTGEVGIWQYTSSGTVNGINGNVDLDTSLVDYNYLIKFLNLNGF